MMSSNTIPDHSTERNNQTSGLSCGSDVVWMQRSKLPAKMSAADFNVWSFVKQCIGKDLTKISMPVVLNEPTSFLQRIAEYMEYSEILLEAVKHSDPIRRLEYVCAFAVSATSSNWKRTGKPFNPLLGETYELHHNGFVFVAEQVSHHPPITAFHVESEHYRLWSTVQFKLRFWGKSIEVQPKGVVTLELLKPHEWYTWQNPNLAVHNVLMGKIWTEHVGTLSVTNHTLDYSAELEFQPASWFTTVVNQVVGKIYKRPADNSTSLFGAGLFSGSTEHSPLRILFGNWTRGLFSVDPHCWNSRENNTVSNNMPMANDKKSSGGKESETNDLNPTEGNTGPEYGFELPLPDQRTLWLARSRPADSPEFYNFTQFTIGLNELTPTLKSARFERSSQANTRMSESATSSAGELLRNSMRTSVISSPFLPPTDCRFRPDIRALESQDLDAAAIEKNRLEEKQRHVRKLIAVQQSRPGSSQSTTSLTHTQHSLAPNDVSVNSCTTKIDLPAIGRPRTTRSLSSVGSRLIVGPVWFRIGHTETTKQEEWKFTGDYWARDWSRCPDLY
ncbi:Oxysterol-binding protein [Fasciola hepatica]|uniref:Oxysterol-binding protein n=1 Tax=Fasciola hepatica TaxID=6192 RepID=A0A4E0RFR2_FASHE|nr:Oxysterol-binding protein [Fasciola hepatica]